MVGSLAIENGEGEYTKDGSVDLRGNPILRSKRGGWTACSFIVVYEVFERLAYYAISSNLVLYLTEKLHQGTVHAANNVTTWVGTVFLTPLLGAYIADAHLGRYWTFVAGSAIYILGMLLLTLSVSVRSLKPPPCTAAATCPPASKLQLGIFFSGLYIIALGNGATKPNISTIGADQFDEFHPKERMHKLSFFNWWMASIFVGILCAQTFLVYMQENVGWTVGYGVPTLALLVVFAVFLVGTPFYRHKLHRGSPFTRMCRVLVAAMKKWRVPAPSDPRELHELDEQVYEQKRKFRIDSTNSMRFLNKASIKEGGPETEWTLCTVTEVEETKQIFRTIPVLITLFIPSTILAQVSTLFVKQGTTLDRHIGPRFQLPAASLQAFVTFTTLVSVVLYDRYFVKAVRKWTRNPRGITLLQRLGIGLLVQIVTILTAFLTERKRVSVAREHGLQSGGVLPITIFLILPQFVLMGISDAFWLVGKLEFFYDQAPDSMKSLGTALSLITDGVGNLLSTFLLKLVSEITRKRGKEWIPNNLNSSHIDYYYLFLTILGILNFMLFLLVSRMYTYKAELFKSIEMKKEEQEEQIVS